MKKDGIPKNLKGYATFLDFVSIIEVNKG